MYISHPSPFAEALLVKRCFSWQDMFMTDLVIVTGCAGFIGSNLVDSLLKKGHTVVGIDNLSTGKSEFMSYALRSENFSFFEVDLLNCNNIADYFQGASRIYHLSANADVRRGPENTSKDLYQNTVVTQRVLEAAKTKGIEEFVFASTGSVYGECEVIPTPEYAPFPTQTSLYGASKLASEGLVSAYSEAFKIKSFIFRFVSILGPRYSHGHVFDFVAQLRSNPAKLNVLGDGTQRKSYLHVNDCISAIDLAISKSKSRINIYNLGSNSHCDVKASISWIIDELGLNPEIHFGREKRGWVGDNPFIFLDTKKIRNLGWSEMKTIEESIRDTVKFLRSNEWLFLKSEAK